MEPKILIISNNALSTTSNNGKTLESFLHYFDKNRIAQLYLKNEIFPYESFCSDVYDEKKQKTISYKINGYFISRFRLNCPHQLQLYLP